MATMATTMIKITSRIVTTTTIITTTDITDSPIERRACIDAMGTRRVIGGAAPDGDWLRTGDRRLAGRAGKPTACVASSPPFG
jgi:hypothetical protein